MPNLAEATITSRLDCHSSRLLGLLTSSPLMILYRLLSSLGPHTHARFKYKSDLVTPLLKILLSGFLFHSRAALRDTQTPSRRGPASGNFGLVDFLLPSLQLKPLQTARLLAHPQVSLPASQHLDLLPPQPGL